MAAATVLHICKYGLLVFSTNNEVVASGYQRPQEREDQRENIHKMAADATVHHHHRVCAVVAERTLRCITLAASSSTSSSRFIRAPIHTNNIFRNDIPLAPLPLAEHEKKESIFGQKTWLISHGANPRLQRVVYLHDLFIRPGCSQRPIRIFVYKKPQQPIRSFLRILVILKK